MKFKWILLLAAVILVGLYLIKLVDSAGVLI